MSQIIDISKINRHTFMAFVILVRKSVMGAEFDYTSGSLRTGIILLAVPMVLEMLMESIFAVVDIWFVSRLGAEAVAAVGITESLLTIVYSLGVGFSVATTAMVSRRIGEGQPDRAALAAFQAIVVGTIVSMFIALIGIIYASDILKLMGASEKIYTEMATYTAIMLGGNITVILLFIINAIFRSAGNPALSLRVLWIANLLNIILDPILIFGLGPIPALGLEGAAIATTSGRGLALIYQIYLLINGKQKIKLLKKHLMLSWTIIRRVFRLSFGAVSQHLISSASWIVLVRIIAEFGSETVAGYTIVIRIIIFFLLPAIGIGNAAATMVGQNLGARQAGRAVKSVGIAATINAILLGVIAVIFMIFPEHVLGIFIQDPQVIASGTTGLQIISAGFVFYGLSMVYVESINGAGDTTTPVFINIFCFWILEIPLAWLLSIHFDLKETGVYLSIVIAESIMAIIAWVIFRRGKWLNRKV